MIRKIFVLSISLFLFLESAVAVHAQTAKLGMHVLFKEDMPKAVELLKSQDAADNQWYYITIPYSLEDVQKKSEWQHFFTQARSLRVIPILRLVTKPEGEVWIKPSRKNITDQLNALAELEWPTAERRVIVFNEVNHAKEWGNSTNPAEYARTLRFASLWARSLGKNFIILPAAMDLAAPSGAGTMEAFIYFELMYQEDPEIFSYIDGWNSHSYPNPAFSAPPTAKGKNSLRGYEYELAYLKSKGVESIPVYITETGWEKNRSTERKLAAYYKYALEKIWLPDDRIVAVTPFVFNGDPGPFANFSFVSADGEPNVQHNALEKVLGATTKPELP